MRRAPAVAGYFYPEERESLLLELKRLVKFSPEKIEALGIVVPHAGYMYSGEVAGKVYGKILPPEVAIIMGPNHTGLGERVSLFDGESFLTPLGEAQIEKRLSELLLAETKLVKKDKWAHLREHSLEVQLPFLQFLTPHIKILPLCLWDLDLQEIKELGRALAKAIKIYKEETGKKVLIVASSDFSHYEPQKVAQKKDSLAIKEILSLSEENLLRVVFSEKISMCGVIPVSVTLFACKELGAKNTLLVDYKTSGDVTGDYTAVVGYGGIIIY
ncbi:MAG: AmmeMemoRadiSam system protein B [Caldimicrobium sp.]|jgi:AmmeMemoRadiSam system protein B